MKENFFYTSKLILFFKTTINNSNIFTESGDNEVIDQNTFIDILAQCAFEIPYRTPEPSSVEKVKFSFIFNFIDSISLCKVEF